MDYKKPQDTLVHGGIGLYPLTTADQVILADGGRLEKAGKINADKLDGRTFAEIMLTLYPVGAVYISVNSTSPASLFGGTWEQLQDRFLLGAGSTYSAGSKGGEAQSKIKNSNLPNTITLRYSSASGGPGGGGLLNSAVYTAGIVSGYAAVGTGQSNESFSNLPPYLAVYMWQRTA